MEPRSQLIYRYLQVAVSMAVDLHLNIDPSVVVRQADAYAGEYGHRVQCHKSTNRSSEALRAALGCFYLSSV